MPRYDVGGQAVIEGVMMRSPRSFAVVCRRPSGQIVIREDAWQPVWGGMKFLRWPFFRGAIVLVESMLNGYSALSFAAEQQLVTQPVARSLGARAAPQRGDGTMSKAASTAMFAISIVFGLALFVGVPHLLTWALGFNAASAKFHLVDGAIKIVLLLGYLAAIGLLPDVKRVFQYHGAEHKSIFTYEKGLPLTVENARAQTRFHPRCGTSFLFIVVGISIVVFAGLLRGHISSAPLVDNLVKIVLKLPLMLPVAGLAYELLKLTGRFAEKNPFARALAAPGMWLQRITTREPTDEQLEIALLSIRKTLWREAVTASGADAPAMGQLEIYDSVAQVDLPLG